MRKIAILLIISLGLFFLSNGIQAQNHHSAFVKEDAIKQMDRREALSLKRDAVRLALKLEGTEDELKNRSVHISEDKAELMLGVLAAIRSSDLPQAKELAKFCLHVEAGPPIDEFMLIYDKSANWAYPLEQGINETASTAINNLMQEYDLTITKCSEWGPSLGAITLRSSTPYNIAALSQQFMGLEGIKSVELKSPSQNGEVRDIEVSKRANGWLVKFLLKWENCASGCDLSHWWTFFVEDATFAPKFVLQSGDPLPEWLKCE
jgi:hypothetical protein